MSSLLCKKNHLSIISTRISPFLHSKARFEGCVKSHLVVVDDDVRFFSSTIDETKKSPFTATRLVHAYELPIATARSLLEKMELNNPKVPESDLHLFFGMNKSTREEKMRIYKKWGWSQKNLDFILKKHPDVLLHSDRKIASTMNFLVNKMGYKSVEIAKTPSVLHYSLENRIIPRCLVYKLLSSKGLISSKQLGLSVLLKCSGNEFEERFVTRYVKDVPQVLDLYQGKSTLSEL